MRERGFFEVKQRPAGDHLASMADEILKQFNQGKESRLVISKGNQIDPEHGLHLGMLIQVIEDDVRVLTLS